MASPLNGFRLSKECFEGRPFENNRTKSKRIFRKSASSVLWNFQEEWKGAAEGTITESPVVDIWKE